ncbi:MAG: hypothetical protein ABFC77_03275 [Thermoguttaceae bacterium]
MRTRALLSVTSIALVLCGGPVFGAGAPKTLNNFVAELTCQDSVPSGRAVTFEMPREGWVYVVVQAKGGVTGSFSKPADLASKTLVFRPGDSKTAFEAMKYLPKGKYTVQLTVASGDPAKQVVVRAIPEIFYGAYGRQSRLHECNDAANNWAFLEKYVNPNINTLVFTGRGRKVDDSSRHGPPEAVYDEWTGRGKHWVEEVWCDFSQKTVDDALKFYRKALTLNPGYDGYLLDEFITNTTEEQQQISKTHVKALEKIAALPEYAGRKIYPYVCSPLPKCSDYADVCKFAVTHHTLLAREWYTKDLFPATPVKTLEDVWSYFNLPLHVKHRRQWHAFYPGAEDSLMVTLGGWNVPDACGDINPQLDNRVLLDWQMNFLANHPVYQNVRGINLWISSYMDEELIRWVCCLYRHYCIEGKRTLFSSDPYELTHLTNPDFDRGLEGWKVEMADKDSVRADTLKDFGKMQGRHHVNRGDHFVVMQRSDKRPNSVSQTVKNLKPGKLYAFRMYTADYDDVKAGRANFQKHAVSVSISGGTMAPGKELHFPYDVRKSVTFAPFNKTKNLCVSNYHWMVFRADGATAKLTVSDWASKNEAGGPVGQRLAFNFFQLEPYFDSDASR